MGFSPPFRGAAAPAAKATRTLFLKASRCLPLDEEGHTSEEAGKLLGAEPPNVSRAKEILDHIRQTDQHATEIISQREETLEAQERGPSARVRSQ